MTPEELAQGQLDAYNEQDLDKFCSFFSDEVRIYDAHSKELLFCGMKDFRTRYAKTFSNPNLQCTLLNRIVHENVVIDHESVVGLDESVTYAVAIYHTRETTITEVHFY